MKNIIALIVLCYFMTYEFAYGNTGHQPDRNAMEWKAGVAEVVITPEQPMWMAGYGNRDHPSEGKLHDVRAKALAFEDAEGKQAVMITSDLLGLPKAMSDRIRDQIETSHGLSRAQIILNSSHTHSAPVLQDALFDIYPMDSHQLELVQEYSDKLEDTMVDLVGEALDSMEPATIYAENGVTRFAVNRRNNPAQTLKQATQLAGPSDHAVPVIKVVNQAGETMAIAFGYACHPTTLSGYQWSGDYPGFAQLELEKDYPDAMVLFFQGAGADQNPMPRRTVALAMQYGRSLAAAVQRVLDEDMRPLASKLSMAYSEVDLQLTEPPTKAEFASMAEEATGYHQRWAARLYKKLDGGESLRTTYPYPVQVWQLGDQPIFSLGGELVVDYAIEIKRIFGQDTFVMGYSNDVMAYIPSARILMEGGYEGASSQMVYGQPSSWSSNIETVILNEIMKVAKQAGLTNY
ncbi:MAG: neutral/alkaline non-lysosomal ceramidase N-terminal domain-containing protein [Balneolales bacterium]